MENILENNRLIAEFMGAIASKRFPDGETLEYLYEAPTSTSSYHWSLKGMEYSSRWDWLMPVVEKIENIGYWSELMSGNKHIVFAIGKTNETTPMFVSNKKLTTKIQHVYDTVIQFIKWYNEQ